MKRAATSTRELERVEVVGRVGQGTEVGGCSSHAAVELSQVKLRWRRYQHVGRQGMKHAHAGRPSNPGKPMKLPCRVLNLIKKKIFRFGGRSIWPTLPASHLADGDGIVVVHETLRRWMLAEHL